MAAYIAARTSFFDDQLLAACERGAGQVVILSAGCNARPVRFRQPNVAFFEVDHPDTPTGRMRRRDVHRFPRESGGRGSDGSAGK